MGLLAGEPDGRLGLTNMSHNHLLPGGPFDMGDYLGLAVAAAGPARGFRASNQYRRRPIRT
jgi:hypothetical protein